MPHHHPTSTPEAGAARRFWEQQMKRHPTLHGMLSLLGSVAEFFTGGHFLVRLGQRVVMTGGVIAETSLLFATLWVTADYTVPQFLRTVLPAELISTCNSLSQASFSLLPEIILASAIVTTVQLWQRAGANWQSRHWVWAGLYSAPTLTFLALTLYTILTFSSQGGSIAQASGAALALRCFAGYSYALLELVYARIGKAAEPVVSRQDHLKTVETLHTEHEERLAALHSQHQQALANLAEQHEQRLGQMELQHESRLLLAVQEVKSSTPCIDSEALALAVARSLEARIEATLRQHSRIIEARHEAPQASKTRQLEGPQKSREARRPASPAASAGSNILPLVQAGTAITEVRAQVSRLVEQGLSSYQIAPLVGKSPATIQRWIKDRAEAPQRSKAEATTADEADGEATETTR